MRYDNWDDFMAAQRRSGLLGKISEFVTAERSRSLGQDSTQTQGPAIYPPSGDVMRFTTTPLRDVKVVILGQDPYHGPGQAHGLAFSVPDGVTPPPSLKNIFRELDSDWYEQLRQAVLRACDHVNRNGDYICSDGVSDLPAAPTSGDLTPWTRQGVLLLNTALTVRQADPGSHLDIWQPFTDEVVRTVVHSADITPHFILWGKPALKTFQRCGMTTTRRVDEIASGIYLTNNVTYTHSTHPSPLSADRGFFGSRPFSRANEALRLRHSYGNDAPPQVDWRLP